MELSAAQRAVAAFVAAHRLATPVPFRLLDLTSEVGELAKEVLKATDYGRRPFESDEAWAGELADVLFAVLCLADSTGVDLDAALRRALEGYERRIALRGDAGSGR